MDDFNFSWFLGVLVTLAAFLLITAKDWRWNLIFLAVQYVGVVALISALWPFTLAITRLVAGWMASAVLGIAALNVAEKSRNHALHLSAERSAGSSARRLIDRAFYFLAGLMVVMVISSHSQDLAVWIPGVPIEHAWSGLVLIGFGLLKTGFTDQPLLICVGLLSTLAGFEIIYAAIQSSLLMAGLLSGVTLALALAGSYLIVIGHTEVPD